MNARVPFLLNSLIVKRTGVDCEPLYSLVWFSQITALSQNWSKSTKLAGPTNKGTVPGQFVTEPV